jgi:hypothetical protein
MWLLGDGANLNQLHRGCKNVEVTVKTKAPPSWTELATTAQNKKGHLGPQTSTGTEAEQSIQIHTQAILYYFKKRNEISEGRVKNCEEQWSREPNPESNRKQ